MKENIIGREYEFDKPLIQKIDSLIDNCIRDCHKEYFHIFDYLCVYEINLTNIGNNELINLKISGNSMNLYELNKDLQLLDLMVLYLIKKIN